MLSEDAPSSVLEKIFGKNANDSDKYHFGKIIYTNLSRFPDIPNQIDVITGEMETNGMVLSRLKKFVQTMIKLGIEKGDVIGLVGPNHMDIYIPYIGAFMLGAMCFPMDMSLKPDEYKRLISIGKPKMIFCENSKVQDLQEALSDMDENCVLYSFGETNISNVETFANLMENYAADVEFQIISIDPAEDGCLLICTSGSTGFPKAVLFTHKALALRLETLWDKFDYPDTHSQIVVASQLHWISSFMSWSQCVAVDGTRLQTAQTFTPEVTLHTLNKYDANTIIMGSPLAISVTKHNKFKETTFRTGVKNILVGGSDVPIELLTELKSKIPNGKVKNIYGLTETVGLLHTPESTMKNYNLSVGKKPDLMELKIVDQETREEVGPNQHGELLVRGCVMFKEYYRDPEATEEAFENGWLKTGDMFYCNEEGSYFFVERIKFLLKYLNHQISPQELEGVISFLPGIKEVGVTGKPVPGEGEYPIAFVVLRQGFSLSEDDIKNVVNEKLSPFKQLRGGVAFVDSLPLTSTGKINRKKLKEIGIKMAQ